MAVSHVSGPFEITNGLVVGGTAHITGALTLDGALAAATGNITAGTSLIWASGTAGKYTGLTTVGNVTAGTSVIWPNGTADTSGMAVRGAISATTTLAVTGNATLGGTVTAGTTRMLFGTFPVTAVVNASTWGDMCFNTRPTSGSAFAWVCTAPGTPGTWLACGSAA